MRIMLLCAVPGAGGNAARPVLRQPVQNGDICDMDALESLVHHTLYDTLGWELGREGAVIIAEPLLMNRRTREQITQLFFEVFNVEGLFMQAGAYDSVQPGDVCAPCHHKKNRTVLAQW